MKNEMVSLKEKKTMLYSKNDVFMSTDTFQTYRQTSNEAYGDNPFCSYSTPNFTWKAGLKVTKKYLHYITNDKLRFLLENNMRGEPSSCMG